MSRPWLPPFLHSVASGDPTPDGVVIWTRVSGTDEPVEVTWVVARDPGLEHRVAEGATKADERTDFTVHVDVDGLGADQTYYYAFEGLGQRSPVGRTRTLPEGNVERVRFGACSCAKYSAGFFNAYARLADRQDLQFVLHLGDYIYEYGNDDKGLGEIIGRPMIPLDECRTLEDYRRRYAYYRLDPDLRALHLTHPVIATVDDHEFCNNTWRGGAKYHDDDEGPWIDRKRAAFQAWREWMPARTLDAPDGDPRIYRHFEIGRLADLFLIDGRTRRDEQVQGAAVEDPSRTLLGSEQYEWLTDQLARSRAAWRLVAGGVMIGPVATRFMPHEVGEPLSEIGVLTERDRGPPPDQWDGYPAERDRLFRHIKGNGIGNVVFVTGDVHSAWAVELNRDDALDDDEPLAAEFVATSVTTENLDEEMGVRARTRSLDIEREVMDDNPHIRWCELDSHGYLVIEVDRGRARCEWYFVDDILRPAAAEALGAAWELRSGSARLHRV